MWLQIFFIGRVGGLKKLYSHIFTDPERFSANIVWSINEIMFKVLMEKLAIFCSVADLIM
jgi:hypothetical protein